MEKRNVLVLADSPAVATGFAQVARNILKILHDSGEYKITVIGINQSDYYDREKYPYAIYEAAPNLVRDLKYRDLYGRQRMLDFLGSGEFDILFTIQDTFIMEDVAQHIVLAKVKMAQKNQELGRQRYKPFKWIFYFPIDGTPKSNWILKSAILADYPVCYTNWGKELALDVASPDIPASERLQKLEDYAKKIRVIYHGTNLTDFHPVEQEKAREFRTRYFNGKADGKFLVLNVNRNQPRKDLPRTLAAFDKLVQRHPDSFLYIHCQAQDQAGDIFEVARNFKNIHLGENWTVPQDFSANKGIPISDLNLLYNAADCAVTSTLGEGWGLSITEAMATETPIVAPRNSSVPEILGENDERGLTVDCGHEFVCLQNDNEVLRPLTSTDDLADKLAWVKEHLGSPELEQKVQAAYDWVKEITWESPKVGGQWLQTFKDATSALQLETSLLTAKVGRNELCPCGSGRKFKNCHG